MDKLKKSCLCIYFTGANSSLGMSQTNQQSPLERAAVELGNHLTNSEDHADVFVCIDFKAKYAKVLNKAKHRGAYIVLVKQEPPIVYPEHNQPNPRGLFDLIITRGVPNSGSVFNTYQVWDDSQLNRKDRIPRAVAINANKWSADNRELYSLRRKAFSSDNRIDVYGQNWEKSFFWLVKMVAKEFLITAVGGVKPRLLSASTLFKAPLNSKGPTNSKTGTLSSYKVSLIIENFEGYMSEKLVDSILCGTIPVYVGPNPSLFGIPEDLVYWSNPNIRSISAAISRALEENHEKFLLRANHWANSPGVKNQWESSLVCSRIIEKICESYFASKVNEKLGD